MFECSGVPSSVLANTLHRRWRRISESDMLWTNVCLDEWGITHFSEDQLKTIIKHARGFRNFSVAYIDVNKHRFKETQSTAHNICKSLCLSHGLNYLNLSGQLVSNLPVGVFDPKLLHCIEGHISDFFL